MSRSVYFSCTSYIHKQFCLPRLNAEPDEKRQIPQAAPYRIDGGYFGMTISDIDKYVIQEDYNGWRDGSSSADRHDPKNDNA